MSIQHDDITIKKPVLEMLTVANEYCYYFDRIENKEPLEIIEFVYRVAPLLYLKGTLVPETVVENPELNERYVTPEQWETLFYALREKFGYKDEFWIIDPQYVNENEPLKASLSENICDIYQDMKDFVLLYQKNTLAARQNAVHEIRRLFAVHWGYRITNMMPKIHYLMHENEAEPPEFLKTLDMY
jgi:hypothetical protein